MTTEPYPLPSEEEIQRAIKTEKETPLHLFMAEYRPLNRQEDDWRACLSNALAYAVRTATAGAQEREAALQADRDAAQQMVAEMREALNKCAVRFREYETLHARKDTLEGSLKAESNAMQAEMCEKALSASAPIADKWVRREEMEMTESQLGEAVRQLTAICAIVSSNPETRPHQCLYAVEEYAADRLQVERRLTAELEQRKRTAEYASESHGILCDIGADLGLAMPEYRWKVREAVGRLKYTTAELDQARAELADVKEYVKGCSDMISEAKSGILAVRISHILKERDTLRAANERLTAECERLRGALERETDVSGRFFRYMKPMMTREEIARWDKEFANLAALTQTDAAKLKSYEQVQCPTCKHLIYEDERCHRCPPAQQQDAAKGEEVEA